MLFNTLRPPVGSRKNKKRLGRGESSGLGKTSGRGHKGQKARSGGYHKVGFEGGQMPLVRRLPKRGFNNIFRDEFSVVNVADLNGLKGMSEIDVDALKKCGLVRKAGLKLKVLGDGQITSAMAVKAHKFSKTAVTKIEKAGGKAIVV